MLACLALVQGFFLPSFSSPSSTTNSNIPKKSEYAAAQWPYMRDSIYYGQPYHDAGAFGHAVPVAVPYPVAVPAPAPPPAPAQVQMALPQSLQGASSIQAAAAAYHNMQLVPCLCSVPKDDVDDSNSV
ncbi:hypothetical protein L9F63_007531, partial [Diploptera punctata]